jgi:hypothetical protein
MTRWVNHDILGRTLDVAHSPKSDEKVDMRDVGLVPISTGKADIDFGRDVPDSTCRPASIKIG